MRRLLAASAAALACLAAPAAARADKLLPPPGKVYTGVTGKHEVRSFTQEVGRAPSVFGFFTRFGGSQEYIYDAVERAGSRLMLHLSTQDGYGTPESVTPLELAEGEGDHFLLAVNARVAQWGQPTYIRLMAEMNQANNGYAAFDADGSSRGASHSTAAFRDAWRRATLVFRGGSVARIDARLRRLGLPPLDTALTALPAPPVAMAWVPQTRGTPDIPANLPRHYWPGGKYVDWVGTDFYSKYPNFPALSAFYREFRGKPFLFGEWGLWDGDDPGFVADFFDWVEDRRRVKLLVYNQGVTDGGPFRLERYPRGRRALARELRDPRYLGLP